MTEAKPKRCFQFSIRELLLVTVIIGLSLGWWLDRRDRVDTPRPVMHYLGNTEAALAANRLKTIWADSPAVKISVDKRNNAIVAFARPSQQAAIREWTEQFDRTPGPSKR